MKTLVQITVKECSRAMTYDPVSKKETPRVSSKGEAIFLLRYITKNKVLVGGTEIEEVKVKDIKSLVEVKPTQKPVLLETESFVINGKLYLRVIAEYKTA